MNPSTPTNNNFNSYKQKNAIKKPYTPQKNNFTPKFKSKLIDFLPSDFNAKE
ncbi:MAG: hypothetical protein PHO61_00830 [Candidatus ainarchaeum sp.]|nr:hypothetical protein [Candidatus ainarchaeum sp.]